MRRILYRGEKLLQNPPKEYDVVIAGSGIAGLYAALNLPEDKKIAIVTKTEIDGSNSWMAQGGIAAVLTPEDTYLMHEEDTFTAGAGLCKKEAVQVLVEEGPENIRQLEKWQVPFDYNEDGDLILGREGGHRLRRIAHAGGDATGRETTKRLGQLAMQKKNIDIYFKHYMIDIFTDENGVCGISAFREKDGEIFLFLARHIIVATGGIGQIYRHTTNPLGAVGDGMAAAARAGAVLENMEMVQFHPTTLTAGEVDGRLFLISEAVRGEGAKLKNGKGEYFMQGKHPMADLAPRDIVTRCILKELRRTGEDRAYLDCSHMTREFFSARFPTIFAQCERVGIHVPEDAIPIHPAQHYFMGGVQTGLFAETAVPGLYACGEVSCTGVHGANRLASNSMLECLVFGRRCAQHITKHFRTDPIALPAVAESAHEIKFSAEEVAADRKALRKTVSDCFGPVRHRAEMAAGEQQIAALLQKYENAVCENVPEMELCNMLLIADKIAKAAIARKESVGAHYVED